MPTEPSYPPEAAVGDPLDGAKFPSPGLAGGETLGVAMSANETSKHGDSAQRGRNTRNFVAGAAIGVGSAALVAALLYARSSRRTPEKDPAPARVIDHED